MPFTASSSTPALGGDATPFTTTRTPDDRLWQRPPQVIGNRSYPTMPSMAYHSMDIASDYPAIHRASNPLPQPLVHWTSDTSNMIQSPPSSPGTGSGANLNSILTPLFPTSPLAEQQMPPSSDWEGNSNVDSSAASSPTIEQRAWTGATSALTKPAHDYKTLVIMALESSAGAGGDGMTICSIYDYVTSNFPYYRSGRAPPTWRSRIRNVLTVNDCFCRIPDPRGGRKGRWLYERPINAKPIPQVALARAASQDSIMPSSSTDSFRGGQDDDKATYLQRAYSTNAASSQPEAPRAAAEPEMGPWTTFSFDDSRPAASESHSSTTRRLSTFSLASCDYTGWTSTPDLLLRELDSPRRGPLSSASLEMIDQLAIELKNECFMLPHSFSDL